MSEAISEGLTDYGYEESRSLYGEEQLIHDYSSLPTEQLHEKARAFIDFLQDPDTLPKHKAQVRGMLDHIIFEVQYREGFYTTVEEEIE